MLCASNKQGDVLAWEVSKEDGPFTCPSCKELVLIKKGCIKIHHFAHIPPTNCAYGVGESEAHRKAKVEIYEALSKHSSVTNLKLERSLGEVRPDISFYFHTTPIAIEVQVSTLSLDTIDRRTRVYTRKGISLLWISPYESRLDEERYAPSAWEKYLHTLYFGKVYYWLSSEILLPVHFAEYQLYVKESSWWEGEGSDAEEVSVGGYYRKSKRYKTPQFDERILITQLSTVQRKAWASSTISVPAGK